MVGDMGAADSSDLAGHAHMNRRHTDLPHHAPETREATLEVLVDHYKRLRDLGSDNFQRYRRRAMWAFGLLAIANGVALYLAIHNATVANRELARGVQQVTLSNCRVGNELRQGLRMFVDAATSPERGADLRRLAAESFGERDCVRLARKIK